MSFTDRQGLIALRILIASQLVIHGAYRTLAGGVPPFGEWLGSRGLPGAGAIAIAITAIEIAGGLALIGGRWVRPLAAVFAVQLAVGIAMVHAPEGWFVVGGGRNGMEYSVVLIGGLIITGLTASTHRAAGNAR